MTNLQLGKLHQYRQRVERLTGGVCDRAWFDLVLRNVGSVRPKGDAQPSSKQLGNAGFERVMAFLEDEIARFEPNVGNYWRDRDARQGNYLSSRQLFQIGLLLGEASAAGVPYTLPGLLARVTHHRADDLNQLCPVEANNLIELLKAATARQEAKPR